MGCKTGNKKDSPEARLPVSSLVTDPHNARRHNSANIEAIAKSLHRFGQRTRLVVRRDGNVVLKGNGTLQAAKSLGWTELDCLLVDDDQKTGQAYAIADNRSGELAEWDNKELAAGLAALDDDLRTDVFADDPWKAEAEAAKRFEKRPEWTEDIAPVVRLLDGRRYASSNEWGIPDLRPDMLGDVVPTACHDRTEGCEPPALFIYRDSGTHLATGHVVAFFEWDARFQSAWTDSIRFAERLVQARPVAVCAPDFSLWGPVPWAVQIYEVYRRAWCCRLWQDAGLKVIPIVSFSTLDTIRWAIAGIPKDAPVVALQARSLADEPGERGRMVAGFADALGRLTPARAIVYAEKAAADWLLPNLPTSTAYTLVEPNVRRKR